MRRVRAAAVAILACAVVASAAALAAPLPPTPSSTVVVLLAPYLTWQDIDSDTTPTLAQLADEGALGCVAVRGGVRPGQVPDDLRGAAVMSAGQHVPAPTAADMSDPASPYGLLGEAVVDAGGSTGAIGSGALSIDEAGVPSRSAAYVAAMDAAGRVELARIDEEVLRTSPIAPLGITADLDAYRGLLESLGEADERGSARPMLVVLDPGDGARAREAAENGGSWASLRRAAAHTADEVAEIALANLPDNGALIVVSTAEYEPGGVESFGPLIVHGRGSGVLYSPRTRLEGIAALPDVSATALAMLGLETPIGMVGSPLELRETPEGDASSLAAMLRIDGTARAFDAPRMPIYYGFIGICTVVLLLALVVMVWPALRARRWLRRTLAALVLVCLSVPLGTYIAQIAGYPVDATDAWLRLGLSTALLAIGVLVLAHTKGFVAAVGAVAATTTLVILADQLVGAPLAYGGIFSYSPLFGTRYYGIGNEGAAVLVGTALIAAVLLADSPRVGRPWTILGVGAAVVAIGVVPFAGANVGVAAWGTVGFLTCWAYHVRKKVSWRVALSGVVVVAAVVVLAVLLDLASDSQSHLGAAVDAFAGGGGVGELLGRKIALNIEALTTTPLVILLPVIMALLTYALVRPRGWVASFIEQHRGFAAVLAGALAAALVGAFSEDSGVSVSAIVVLYGLGGPLVVALADEAEVGA